MAKKDKASMEALLEDYATKPVPNNISVGGFSIAMINTALAFSLPTLLTGVQVGSSIGFKQSILAFLWGGLIVALIGSISGLVGIRNRISTYMVLRFSFGSEGSKLINLLVAFSLFGWFGVNVYLFGQAASELWLSITGMELARWIFVLTGGIVMTAGAIFGFKSIQKLAVFVVPVQILILTFLLNKIFGNTTIHALLAIPTQAELSLGESISVVVGCFIVAAVIMPDFTRYGKTWRDSVIASFIPYLFATTFTYLITAAAAIWTDQSDILALMVTVGLGVFAFVLVIFSSWITNSINLYGCSLSVSAILSRFKEWQIVIVSLDSLMDPQTVMQEAQELAAEAFGSKRTFFLTNGTSTANKVVVQQLLGAGGKILLDRGSHKSMHHAVIMHGIEPIYLSPSLQPEYGLYGPVRCKDIVAAIEAHPDAKLLVLTSCTYDGLYYDLTPIIEKAHESGIKVLIDEAWYAHGRFHPVLRPNALDCGADYVTQSTHKMLSAFSQASMVHVADPDFDEHRFQENLNMHASTSPQYAMIASLDVARKQMSMEGYRLLGRCLEFSKRLREGINQTGVFRVLELDDMLAPEIQEDNIRLDPFKLTIDVSQSGASGKHLQQTLFENHGVQVEKTTHNTISVLVTIGTTDSKVLRLINALQQMSVESRNAAGQSRITSLPPLSELKMLPQDAYFGPTEDVLLTCSRDRINKAVIGRISADEVVPYPPGIPLLVPGQIVSQEIADYLLHLIQGKNSTEVHGLLYRSEESLLRLVKESTKPN